MVCIPSSDCPRTMETRDGLVEVNPLVRRRNGKTQACEPCRRRKLACDHGYPVCSRCSRRRNGRSECHYLPPGEITRSQENTKPDRPAGQSVSMSDSSFKEHVTLENKFWNSPAARAHSAFFGPTSFSAAYHETEASLAMQRPSVAEEMTTTPEMPPNKIKLPSLDEVVDMTNRDQAATHMATKVLQAIPTREKIADTTLCLPIDPNDEWMRMIGEKLVVSTWETHGHYLRDPTDISKLRELAGKICINTRRVVKEDKDDPQAWLEDFSGTNLRWEAVGIMFLYAGIAELTGFVSTNHQASLVSHYTELCSSCITLANMGGSSSSIMLFLMYKRSVMHACMYGHTSKHCRFHAHRVC